MANQDGVVIDLSGPEDRKIGNRYRMVHTTGETGAFTLFTHDKPFRSANFMTEKDDVAFPGGHTSLIVFTDEKGKYMVQADGITYPTMGAAAKNILDMAHSAMENGNVNLRETELLLEAVNGLANKLPLKRNATSCAVEPASTVKGNSNPLERLRDSCKR